MTRPASPLRHPTTPGEPTGRTVFGGRPHADARARPHGPATGRTSVRAPHALPGLPAAGPPIRSRASAEAVAVVHHAARSLLSELPQLTDHLVALLREQEPAYRSAATDFDGLWREVHESLEHNIRSILAPRETRESARRCSWRIGAERAEQGLPLDALLHAFRLGGGVVWQGLVDATTRSDPDRVHLLVHVAADVWNFVDEHCGLLADAYRKVEGQLTRRREERLRALVGALLDGSTRLADVPAVAAALDLPQQARYAVVVVAGQGRAVLRDPGLRVGVPGTRIIWHTGVEEELGIVQLGDVAVADLAAALTVPRGCRVGVSPAVEELAAVGAARRFADTALRTCEDDAQVALLEDHLPSAMVVSCPELSAALTRRALGPVLDLDPPDRKVLLSTLEVWLDCDGSALRAGTRLFCHRNTVLNRLRRYEQLSGRSLNRQRDLLELALALEAQRLLGE
ncbi:PucR family transcriptional regulator [Actinoalloteichus sp. AHMU CJ021]|uniref:PucR family transcriptional regulator n=1 Tax=Actinoalloteichus sp. AHMU CJ021 TaxID=2072503 RepID=UPI0026A56A1B